MTKTRLDYAHTPQLARRSTRRRGTAAARSGQTRLFVGALLVALALVWSSSLLVDDMLASNNVSQVEIEFQTHTNEYTRVLDAKSKAADIAKKLEALQKLSQARLLQGSLMNALQQISVPNVQLTRLRVEHAYTYCRSVAPKTGGPAFSSGQPASCTEKSC